MIRHSHRTSRLRSAALLAAGLCLPASLRAGQVVTDGTLGPARALAGPNFDVAPDLGQTRGGNLFHSFAAPAFDLGQRIQDECALRLSADVSTFIVTGRGGSPPEPGGWQPAMDWELSIEPRWTGE